MAIPPDRRKEAIVNLQKEQLRKDIALFGELLNAARKRSKLTLRACSKLFGIDPMRLSVIERFRSIRTVPTEDELCDSLPVLIDPSKNLDAIIKMVKSSEIDRSVMEDGIVNDILN